MTIREFFSKKLHDFLIVIGIASFVGFLAPFGMDRLPIHISLLYWNAVCLAGYFVYYPIIDFSEKYFKPLLPKHWHCVAVGAFLASFPMTFVVPAVTWLFFNRSFSFSYGFVEMFLKTLVIGGVITIISFLKDQLVEQKAALAQTQSLDQQQLAKFLELLPIEKRGNLYGFVSEDHYLKIYTDKGHHLILMRFKDAVDMLSDYPGLQTHRSWWVALDAVQSVSKENRKTLLNLVNQIQVPVSKTYAEAVKQAGIY